MRLPTSYCSTMCQRLGARHMTFSDDFHLPSCGPSLQKEERRPPQTLDSVYDAWLASRLMGSQRGTYLVPGSQRPLNRVNARLACIITKKCAFDLFKTIWGLHPVRTTLMMSLNIIRSVFPAFRGYSQAMIIDELQSLISSGSFTWSRLLHLLSTEILRRILEGLLDSFA